MSIFKSVQKFYLNCELSGGVEERGKASVEQIIYIEDGVKEINCY